MLTDFLCWLKYGRTRFGLMEYYGLSIVRFYSESGETKTVWVASCAKREVVVRHGTPYGALITCVELIENGKL